MGLESLVREANDAHRRRLINGDTLRGVFSSEAYPGIKFFATEHGDAWYVQDGEAFQVSYGRRGLKGLGLPVEASSFRDGESYKAERVLADLERISQVVDGRSFLGDETARFRDELLRLADEEEAVVVDGCLIEEAFSDYRPTSGSVAPFGRYTDVRVLVRKMEDDGKRRVWNRPLTSFDSYLVANVACLLNGDGQPSAKDDREASLRDHLSSVNREKLLKAAQEILREYVVGREVVSGKGVHSFMKDHGFNNGNERHEQLYDLKKSRDRWQFFMHDDRDLHVEVRRGEPSYGYERVLFRRGLDDRVRDSVDGLRRWYGGVLRRVSSVADDVKRHVAKNVLPYAIGAMVAGMGGAYWMGVGRGEDRGAAERARLEVLNDRLVEENVSLRWTVDSLGSSRESAEAYAARDRAYVVRPGDCLWNIAEGYVVDASDKAVFEKTNEIAAANGKLTIPEYHEKVLGGEEVSRKEDPNLIFPGDTLEVPVDKVVSPAPAAWAVEEPVGADSIDDAVGGKGQKGVVGAGLAGALGAVAYGLRDGPSALRVSYRKGLEPDVGPLSLPAARPVDYVGVLRDLVQMKNRGASFSQMRDRYDGFRSDDDLRRAFSDYQGFVQSGMVDGYVGRYDHRIAGDDLRHRLVHEYRTNKGSLSDVRSLLRREYGMDVSESTISRYARRELGVRNRKEARV